MTTCLIVDDSLVNRKVAAKAALDCGMDVLEAEDGLAALLICQEQMPDVIVLDWMMPEINGIEFLSLLRNMHDGDQPHVIMCSISDHAQAGSRNRPTFQAAANFNNGENELPNNYFSNSLRDSMIRAMIS